ncbi:MAG: hypothetical protein IRZ16_00815 [Myxococcaceae bacterium]|nr:hypothetical protein [Myxococcaceae bacterium]
MKFRFAALAGALAILLAACPQENGGEDGGTQIDGGPDIGTGGCSGGCGPNLVCNEQTHQCEPGCNPACDEGQLCVKDGDTFTCVTPQTTCDGNVCGEGENTCVQDHCSCQPPALSQRDTCADQGKVCHQTWNSVTQTGGTCEAPRLYEFCGADCQNNECGGCASDQGCDDRLFLTFGICAHKCSNTESCAPGELCYGLSQFSGFCYPASLFGNDFACKKRVTLEDGGTEVVRVSAPETCFNVTENGIDTSEPTPTGTCTWAMFRTDTGLVPFDYCRPAGPVPEFGACKTEMLPHQLADTCGTGLECVPTDNEGNGICQRICNAQQDINHASPVPACNDGEACANLYHRDDNTVVGACVTACNVFSTEPNFGCPAYGTRATSCVPTPANGSRPVTNNGDGICMVQRANVKGEGEPCEEVDALKGAACASGLVCAQVSGQPQPICVKPCDLECAVTDGGTPPARCATEANATCTGGKTCTAANGPGAVLGFCL